MRTKIRRKSPNKYVKKNGRLPLLAVNLLPHFFLLLNSPWIYLDPAVCEQPDEEQLAFAAYPSYEGGQ